MLGHQGDRSGQDMIGSEPEEPRALVLVTAGPIIGRQKPERTLELFAARGDLHPNRSGDTGNLDRGWTATAGRVAPLASPIHPHVESAEEVSSSPGSSSSIDAFYRVSNHVFMSQCCLISSWEAAGWAFRGMLIKTQ